MRINYYIQKKIMAKKKKKPYRDSASPIHPWEHAIQDQPRSSRDFRQQDRTIFVYINIPDIRSEDMDVIETNYLKAN